MTTQSPIMAAPLVRQSPLGWWCGDHTAPAMDADALADALLRLNHPVFALDVDGQLGVAQQGTSTFSTDGDGPADGLPLVGFAPALLPEQLGDPQFITTHGLRYAYVGGAMANGIASEAMVEALGQAGMLGFFGAAGLTVERISAAIDRAQNTLGDLPYGFNLIHSPHEPRREAETVELYLRRGVRLVSAAAYLDLTEPLVRYRLAGAHRDEQGRVIAPNRVIAKVSRVEVARKFFAPPPEALVRRLVDQRLLSSEEAELAQQVPVAEDLTAEADSGGHTDNRPALALLPTMLALRDELHAKFGYATPLRVGAAGGIATPASVAAAFAMGAAYVLTGTINQACVEAGTSETVRKLLAEAGQADVTMAPAADMFEMGVNVQVLKRGTMFAMRARRLYDLYRTCTALEDIPAPQRQTLERDYFRAPLSQVWNQTEAFFAERDPQQIERARRDPKHKLALVFRWFLGQSSNWANTGEPTRQVDYQIWCGPAIGAFNEWARGTFLEKPEHRDVVTVAQNLLVGAAVLTRAGWLRTQGVPLSPRAQQFTPRTRAELATMVPA